LGLEFYQISIQDYKRIISLLDENYGIDVSYYSKIVFRHRMTILMNYYKIKDIETLLSRLEKKQLTEDQIYQFLYIPITEMFRDPAFWRVLIDILKNHDKSRKIRIMFSGGFARNKELFSLLILLKELNIEDYVELTVTTPFLISDNLLSVTLSKQKFELSQTNFNRLKLPMIDFAKYFDKDYVGNYKFKYLSDYIKTINDVSHDFMKDAMVRKQDIIFFRNQLLYFSLPKDAIIIRNLAQTLRPKGLLFLGIRERINNPADFKLKLVNDSEQIYSKL